ncbi:MAG: HAMP domain-containing histidine kinase, partial [Bacteroidetes bacterium]|nr:HAMP domain-containing histidine kinase [Bacteroidota bacterium]
QAEGLKQNAESYKPKVTISTKSQKSPSGDLGVIISVSDNGNGIPQNIIDKIFQPFFTTKPTGKGTGLGLSLAYDIVKAHGGKITIGIPKPEQLGTTFIISLPASNQTS